MSKTDPNIAIVHDWFPTVAGGELVVKEIVDLCSRCKIFGLFDFLTDEERTFIVGNRTIETSRLDKLPFVEWYYRYLLLSCTRVIEEFDLRAFDLVISSSAALAKGVITQPGQPHIAYVHSPSRYAWDMSFDYIASIDGYFPGLKKLLANRMLHEFRKWDMRTYQSIDLMVANSNFIASRIKKIYGRDSTVVYPPVDVDRFYIPSDKSGDYYITASRLVPYKKIDLIVNTFAQRPSDRLIVVGDGPEMKKIKHIAGPNVEIVGYQSSANIVSLMQNAKAFIFAAQEDFGIVPVEAQACGVPVICLGRAGTAETVLHMKTGIHFHEQTESALNQAIDTFEKNYDLFDPESCRQNALRFSVESFHINMGKVVSKFL